MHGGGEEDEADEVGEVGRWVGAGGWLIEREREMDGLRKMELEDSWTDHPVFTQRYAPNASCRNMMVAKETDAGRQMLALMIPRSPPCTTSPSQHDGAAALRLRRWGRPLICGGGCALTSVGRCLSSIEP